MRRLNACLIVKGIYMGLDKLPCTGVPYRPEDQHDSFAVSAPTSATASVAGSAIARSTTPTHIQVDDGVIIETQPMDHQTWLTHVAPRPWSTSQTYAPGDQVIHGGNVYQLAGSWPSHGIRPGTEGSNWWYSGSVQNNYNYYAKHHPGSPSYVEPNRPPSSMRPAPVSPIDGQPGTKSGELKVLENFSAAFPSLFKEIGNFLTKKEDPIFGNEDKPRCEGLTIYGGLNSEDDGYRDYHFESFEKNLAPNPAFQKIQVFSFFI